MSGIKREKHHLASIPFIAPMRAFMSVETYSGLMSYIVSMYVNID